jgi:hypothetical protein
MTRLCILSGLLLGVAAPSGDAARRSIGELSGRQLLSRSPAGLTEWAIAIKNQRSVLILRSPVV